MRRDYHRWFSPALGRDMEMLVYGHDGLPALVFPTSCGRFFDFEDHGMVAAVQHKLDSGQLQLFAVDSVDAESWYNRSVPPRWRIARHMQYEQYILREVLPYLRQVNHHPLLAALGCSFGGYHAANIAFRHPHLFTAMLSMSGAFDFASFLDGYHDEDCYFHQPTQYLPNLHDHACSNACARTLMSSPPASTTSAGTKMNDSPAFCVKRRSPSASTSGEARLATTGHGGERC